MRVLLEFISVINRLNNSSNENVNIYIRGVREQLTPKEQSNKQNVESNKIKTTYQNNLEVPVA